MKKTSSKSKEKNNTSSSKNIKLPLIDQNKKTINYRNDKSISNQKLRKSSSSLFSKNSLDSKLTKNNNINVNEEKQKKNLKKINDIINNVNKSHNINSKIINNKNMSDIDNLSTIKNKGDMTSKINSSKNKEQKKLIFNKKKTFRISEDESKKIMINNIPRITKEKLKEIQERRRIRLIKEKKEYEMQMKLLNENKENNKKEDMVSFSNKINSPIEMNQKKAQNLLEEGGMIDAYKYLITHLCKNGMPPGDLYEYSSIIIKNYEKEWKKKKYKMMNEKIQKYFEDKKKSLLNQNNIKNDKNNMNLYFQVLEKREDNQFIKKLDKSRSSLHIIKRNPILKSTSRTKNNENKGNKSNSFEKNKLNNNINNLKKINGEDIILNGKKNNNIDDKKVYFNIKLKNVEKENKKENNKNEISSNIIKKNTTNKSKNKENNKTNVSNKNNNNLIKNESGKIQNLKGIIKNNKNSPKNRKEENKNKTNNSNSNLKKFRTNKSDKTIF